MSANRTDKVQLKSIRETAYRYAAVDPHPMEDISDNDKTLWVNYIRSESKNLSHEYTTFLPDVMEPMMRIGNLIKEADIINDVAALGEKMDEINPLLSSLKANPFNQLIGEMEALQMDLQIMFAINKSEAMTNVLAETSERVNEIYQKIIGMNEKINKTQASFKAAAAVQNQRLLNVVPPPVAKANSYSDLRKSNSGLFTTAKLPEESIVTKPSKPDSKSNPKKGKGFCNIL